MGDYSIEINKINNHHLLGMGERNWDYSVLRERIMVLFEGRIGLVKNVYWQPKDSY